jgi:mono/diheme cytochrome c family protein
MNRYVVYASLVIFGVVLPLALITAWLTTPPESSAPERSQVAIPKPRLPKVPLPTGTDPKSVALRQSILNGERIYQRLCYHCHGRQGKGDNNDYMASIGHKPADHSDLTAMQKLSDAEFFVALRDGVKNKRGWLTMPPWESVLSNREMWDVIAYVRHLPHAPPLPTPAPN